MDIEDFMKAFTIIVFIIIGFLIGVAPSYEEIKIQDVKPIENGYYITINNEIYYKEVG